MNKNVFCWLSMATGLLYFWLFFQLLITPAQILQSFGVGAEGHVIYLARRISVLMLGFSVLAILARTLPSSKPRAIVATAVALNMAGFACNSFWGAAREILTDPAIPFIGGVEAAIAVFYASFAINDFRRSKIAPVRIPNSRVAMPGPLGRL